MLSGLKSGCQEILRVGFRVELQIWSKQIRSMLNSQYVEVVEVDGDVHYYGNQSAFLLQQDVSFTARCIHLVPRSRCKENE